MKDYRICVSVNAFGKNAISEDFSRGVKMKSDALLDRGGVWNREKEDGGGLERRVEAGEEERGSKVEPATCCTIDQKSRMKGD